MNDSSASGDREQMKQCGEKMFCGMIKINCAAGNIFFMATDI
jgi:hypothetical protein